MLAHKGSFIQWIDADEEDEQQQDQQGRYWPYKKEGHEEGVKGEGMAKYYSIIDEDEE